MSTIKRIEGNVVTGKAQAFVSKNKTEQKKTTGADENRENLSLKEDTAKISDASRQAQNETNNIAMWAEMAKTATGTPSRRSVEAVEDFYKKGGLAYPTYKQESTEAVAEEIAEIFTCHVKM